MNLLSRINLLLHSIRFRLALWFVFILGILLVGFSSMLFYMQKRELQDETLIRLESKLENLEKAFGVDSVNPQTVGEQGFSLKANDNDDTSLQKEDVLVLYNPDGSLQKMWGPITEPIGLEFPKVSTSDEREPLTELLTLESKSSPTQYIFKVVPLYSKDTFTGYLALGTPLDPRDRLGRLLITLIILIGSTLLVSFAGGFWLADRAMHPVKTIAAKAHSISETDLSQRFNLMKKDEIGQLAGTFDSMLARLEAAFARQRQFTADASHELRTPLTIVNLETTRALAASRTAKEYQRVLKIVQSENELMSHLVNDMLILARMDANHMTLNKEVLDLSDLALDVTERLAPLAARQEIKLEAGELPEVLILGDRQSLMQMLTNLVENAIKYTAQNGVDESRHVLIETGTYPDRPKGWVRVSDTGPGIPSEHLAHLFDRFYRVDESRVREEDESDNESAPTGSGLGLAIVEGIARLHGGQVEVQSEPGKGTTFEIAFPLYTEPAKSSSKQ
jgi:heavy metal sensor kinase